MKRVKFAAALMLMSLPFLSMTCNDSILHCESVNLVNYSNDTIYCSVRDNHFFTCYVAPNDSSTDIDVVINWKDLDLSEKTNEFHVLIFKQSTVQRYSRKVLFEKNLYDARLDYTNKELKAMNFRVVYDGKEK